MTRKKRKTRTPKRTQQPVKAGGRTSPLNYLPAFAFGAVIVGGVVPLVVQRGSSDISLNPSRSSSPGVVGQRIASELIALSDAELARVDIAEMNVAVARGIPAGGYVAGASA